MKSGFKVAWPWGLSLSLWFQPSNHPETSPQRRILEWLIHYITMWSDWCCLGVEVKPVLLPLTVWMTWWQQTSTVIIRLIWLIVQLRTRLTESKTKWNPEENNWLKPNKGLKLGFGWWSRCFGSCHCHDIGFLLTGAQLRRAVMGWHGCGLHAQSCQKSLCVSGGSFWSWQRSTAHTWINTCVDRRHSQVENKHTGRQKLETRSAAHQIHTHTCTNDG